MGSKRNLYLHADGDSFFAACEISVRPELRGKPVVVGEDKGIAVAMNAEAKKLGVTRGMPNFRIKKLYPSVIILPHNFELYKEISEKLKQILSSYAAKVEEYSIDECFAEVTPPEIKYFDSEKKFLAELKNEIEGTLGVTYSLGLARTMALAKQASKLEKPAGVVALLNKEDEIKALKNTPIDDIWGIGWRTVPKMRSLGMETAYDFANYSEKKLAERFSISLVELQKELKGQNVFVVNDKVDPRDQKSIQSTATFRPASTDKRIIWRELAENAEHACHNARELSLVSNSISFFVKTSEFKYYFDDAKLELFTSDPGIVLDAIEPKLPKLLRRGERIRSTGVILHNLVREEKIPMDLFGKQEKNLKKRVIEDAADKIRSKYGSGAIKRASSLGATKHRRGRTF